MTPWIIAATPLIALAINVAGQMSMIRVTKRLGISLMAGITCGLLFSFLFLATALKPDEVTGIDYTTSILTYLALSFCYWAFINLNVSSLRIRIMKELLHENDAGLSMDNILKKYSPEEMLNLRIQRLAHTRHIALNNGRWQLQSRSLLTVALINALLRRIVMPKP